MLPRRLRFLEDPRKGFEFLIGLALLFVLSAIAWTGWIEPLENIFLDFRFLMRGQKPFTAPVAVVGIDESSLDAFGRWPWPRDKHAMLIGLLKHPSFRPAALGYDLLFEHKNPMAPEGDDSLVFQTKDFEHPVVMSYFFEKGHAASFEKDPAKEKELEKFALPTSDKFPEAMDQADKVSLPFLELAQASDLAFVNTPLDPDGKTRRAQLLMRYEGKIYPSMDLLLVLRQLGLTPKDLKIGKDSLIIEGPANTRRVIPITPKGEMLINYYGPGKAIPSFSFVEVLQAGKAWMLGKDTSQLRSFKDKIVLVGVTALGLGDRRTTSFYEYESGISLHAQAIANILDNKFLARSPRWTAYATLWLSGLFIIILTMSLRITFSLPSVIGAGVFYLGIAQAFFSKGVWMDVAVQELGMVVLFIGITSFRYFTALEELKRTQAQLIQSAKMASLGELSAHMSHEFRNILSAIGLHVQFANQPEHPLETVRQYLTSVNEIIVNANAILNGLLAFSRKSESIKKPGSLKKTVQDTLLLVEKEITRHQIKIVTELSELPEIAYDSGQVSQVLVNMMNNARDALKDRKDKQLSIRLRDSPKGVYLDIADNGSGIPPHVMKRLFEPFVTTKVAGKGTGLGLSVCHGIIRNHGGDITVETAQGKGTTWHIFLPH